MQEIIDQANKNGVSLLNSGSCQFCGAQVSNGVFECLAICNNNVLQFEYSRPEINQSRFLIVDCHALQHPEIHDRRKSYLHLTRLHLMLVNKITWDYKKTPLLNDYIKQYKKNKPEEFLNPPPINERRKITAKEVSLSTSKENYHAMVQEWAEDIYHVWRLHHTIASGLAADFLKITKIG